MALDKLNLAKMNEFSLNGEKEIKPIIKISELKLGHPYRILGGSLVKSKFGASILLELEEGVIFLPKRVTPTHSPFVEEFKTGKYSFIYRGLHPVGKQYSRSLFEIIET